MDKITSAVGDALQAATNSVKSLTQGRIDLKLNTEYKRDPLKAYAKACERYGICPTLEGPLYRDSEALDHISKYARHCIGGLFQAQNKPLMRKAVTPSSTSTTSTTGRVNAEDIQMDSEYLCPVGVGTPAQIMNLDFDTGSADLWVLSTELGSSQTSQLRQAGHTVYDRKKSSTSKPLATYTWNISYGDGSSASGGVCTDVVSFANLKINPQAVELASKISSAFATGKPDGLCGLAWGNINTVQPKPQKTPVDNLIAQGDIPKAMEVFTANLGSFRDTAQPGNQSFYTFGYIDQAPLKAAKVAEPFYAAVDNSNGFWQVPSTSYKINGTQYLLNGNTAIMDTGTTLLLLDDDVCKQIYAAIPGSAYDSSVQGYVFPTATKESAIPVLEFALGDHTFKLHQDDMFYAPINSTMTYGGIQSRGDLPFDIFGDTALKAIYAIFDVGNKRFGFVQRDEAPAS